MKSTEKLKRTTINITLSEGALDALRVLSIIDMRSKSHEIEYLIIDEVERRNLDAQSVHIPTTTLPTTTHTASPLGNYYVGVYNES